MLFLDFSFVFFLLLCFFFVTFLLVLLALNHFIILLIFLDLLILANILLLTCYTALTHSGVGYSFALIVLGIAASDTAIGLGLFILYYRATNRVSIG